MDYPTCTKTVNKRKIECGSESNRESSVYGGGGGG